MRTMQRGEKITVFPNGLRVSAEALSSIGIFDMSTCWGLWVPDRNNWPPSDQDSLAQQPEHFLISPFEPRSWPVLFRVEMRLNNDRAGTLAAATAPLAENGLSILAIEAVPAGHHHATVNIIGEAVSLKEPNGVLNPFIDMSEHHRTFRDDSTWDYVHQHYAPDMLRYSKQLVEAVQLADEKHEFLREIFLDPHSSRWEPGVLYSYKDLPEDIRDFGSEKSTPAVQCTWLQDLAFFWLYGRNVDDVVELQYKRESLSLKPIPPDIEKFRQVVSRFISPFKAIASFNLSEQYLRVILSDSDMPERTVYITVPYHAHFQPYIGSKGFQHNLYTMIKESGLNLRSVSKSTQHRKLDKEKGKFSLLISNAEGNSNFPSISDVRDKIERIANTAADRLSEIGCTTAIEPVTVEYFASRRLFFSTKFDWIKEDYPDLVTVVEDIAKESGFHLIVGDMNRLVDYIDIIPEIAAEKKSITGSTLKLIQHSDAFLQIIPKTAFPDGTNQVAWNLNWLEFEFGAALALELPYAVIVDLDAGDIWKWRESLRVGNDSPMFSFYGSQHDDTFSKEVRKAVQQLARQEWIRPKLL